MANAAPTAAARICATKRVRRGPIAWNSAIVITTAIATASIARASATAYAPSHRAPLSQASILMNAALRTSNCLALPMMLA